MRSRRMLQRCDGAFVAAPAVTAAALVVYRLGAQLPVPGLVDQSVAESFKPGGRGDRARLDLRARHHSAAQRPDPRRARRRSSRRPAPLGAACRQRRQLARTGLARHRAAGDRHRRLRCRDVRLVRAGAVSARAPTRHASALVDWSLARSSSRRSAARHRALAASWRSGADARRPAAQPVATLAELQRQGIVPGRTHRCGARVFIASPLSRPSSALLLAAPRRRHAPACVWPCCSPTRSWRVLLMRHRHTSSAAGSIDVSGRARPSRAAPYALALLLVVMSHRLALCALLPSGRRCRAPMPAAPIAAVLAAIALGGRDAAVAVCRLPLPLGSCSSSSPPW